MLTTVSSWLLVTVLLGATLGPHSVVRAQVTTEPSAKCLNETEIVHTNVAYLAGVAQTSLTECTIDYTKEDSCAVNVGADLGPYKQGCLDAGGKLYTVESVSFICKGEFCNNNKCKNVVATHTFLNDALCIGMSCTDEEASDYLRTEGYPSTAEGLEIAHGFDSCEASIKSGSPTTSWGLATAVTVAVVLLGLV